jgi:hypothetical protein
MTLDARARGAVQDIRRAVESDASMPRGFGDPARFHRSRAHKVRNQRIVAGLVAAAIAVGTVALVANTFRSRRVPATPVHPQGLIVFERSAPGLESGRLFLVNPDGTDEVALPWSVDVECPTWFADGSKILITGTDYPGAPLRPATINADGSGSVVLDAAKDPNLDLGCGDVSPDGTRLVLEGFPTHDDPSVGGLYSVRASDGGDLTRLTHCGGEPAYLPDGRITTGCTKPGHPLIGAHYILNADGSGMHRVTPWQPWGASGRAGDGDGRMEGSPDGRWLVFTQDDGTLGLVHPDGTRFHTIPIDQPPGSTAGWPQWSPDGTMIVFELWSQGEEHIYTVRPDGSELTAIVNTPGVDEKDPAWGPAV